MSQPKKPLTKDEFRERFKHELLGFVLDAYTGKDRTGPEASMFLRGIAARIDGRLAEMWESLMGVEPVKAPTPSPPPAAGGAGHPKPPTQPR